MDTLGAYLVNGSLKIIQNSYLNKWMNPQAENGTQTFGFHSFLFIPSVSQIQKRLTK